MLLIFPNKTLNDFLSISVDPSGKLPKTWGMLKAK